MIIGNLDEIILLDIKLICTTFIVMISLGSTIMFIHSVIGYLFLASWFISGMYFVIIFFKIADLVRE